MRKNFSKIGNSSTLLPRTSRFTASRWRIRNITSSMERETISRAMLLTPPGSAAIAVVRLRGPNIADFLRKHFSKKVSLDKCVHGTLADGKRIIDDPVVVLNDNSADINLHGGEWIVRECLELARKNGFEIVEHCDEFFDAETMLHREMLAALPQARTEQAIRMLLPQPNLWMQFIERILSSDKPGLQARVDWSKNAENPDVNVRLELSRVLEDRSLWWMLNPPRVAIVGVPNAGKSTLANQLFSEQRSITADIPG